MIDGFRADHEALAERSGAFADLSDRADRIAADLADRLSANGDCWGGDAAGQSFAGCHAEPASAALRSISALPADLLDVGSRLSTTAATYAETESANDDTMRGVGKELEGA